MNKLLVVGREGANGDKLSNQGAVIIGIHFCENKHWILL